MRGHEYVRRVLLDYLADAVPVRLAAILADVDGDEPVPGEVSFVLADSLQDVTGDLYPLVAMRSSEAVDDERAGDGVWLVTYDLQAMVACEHRTSGDEGFQRAGVARDRLMLAVREALWAVRGMACDAEDGDVEFLPGRRPERTGRGKDQSLSGLALSVGTVDFRVRVTEALSAPAPVPVVGVDVGVSVRDASEDL